MSEENSVVTTTASTAPAGEAVAQPSILGTASTVNKPEYIQDKFWDREKGEVNVETLAKSYKELESIKGDPTKYTKLPGENSTPEEMDGFWKQLGKPEKADDYAVNVPEGLFVPDDMLKSFKEACLNNNIPKAQAEKLAEWYMGSQVEAINQWNESINATEAELKKSWGADYQKNIDGAYNTLVGLTSKEEASGMLEKYGNDVSFIKMLNKMNSMVSEDSITEPTSGMGINNNSGMIEEFNSIMKNSKNPLNSAFYNAKHPRHEEAKTRLMELKGKIDWSNA